MTNNLIILFIILHFFAIIPLYLYFVDVMNKLNKFFIGSLLPIQFIITMIKRKDLKNLLLGSLFFALLSSEIYLILTYLSNK